MSCLDKIQASAFTGFLHFNDKRLSDDKSIPSDLKLRLCQILSNINVDL